MTNYSWSREEKGGHLAADSPTKTAEHSASAAGAADESAGAADESRLLSDV
jgi:hypothetical protein